MFTRSFFRKVTISEHRFKGIGMQVVFYNEDTSETRVYYPTFSSLKRLQFLLDFYKQNVSVDILNKEIELFVKKTILI